MADNTPTGISGVLQNPAVQGGLLSGLGALWGTSQANSGNQAAINSAKFGNASVSLPGSSVQATNGPNGLNYSVNSTLHPNFNQFANLSTVYNNAASNPNNPFVNAANSSVKALQNFDPQTYANQQYGNLSALAAPGNTDQTQAMLNYEQASGRGGLTQNGQLGDLGGLALAQSTADNQRRLQSQQLADQRSQQLTQQASGLLQAGSNYNTANLTNSTLANNNALNINQQLLGLLQQTVGAQGSASAAGARQAGYQQQIGINKGQATGNILGALGQGLNAAGGISGLLGKAGSAAPYLAPGMDSNNVVSGYNNQTPLGSFTLPGGSTFDPSGNYQPTQPDYSNPDSIAGMSPDAYGGSDPSWAFSPAGGEAAASSQSWSQPQSVAGYSADAPGSANPTPGTSPTTGGSSNPFSSMGSTLGGLSALGSVANGLRAGGPTGYAGATLSGNTALQKLSGGSYGSSNPLFGAGGSALGIVNGIRQGTPEGYTNAAISGAQLAANPAVASALGIGSGTAAALGAAATGAGAVMALPAVGQAMTQVGGKLFDAFLGGDHNASVAPLANNKASGFTLKNVAGANNVNTFGMGASGGPQPMWNGKPVNWNAVGGNSTNGANANINKAISLLNSGNMGAYNAFMQTLTKG